MKKAVFLIALIAIIFNINLSGCSLNKKEITGAGKNIGKTAGKTEKEIKKGGQIAKETAQNIKQGYKEEKK